MGLQLCCCSHFYFLGWLYRLVIWTILASALPILSLPKRSSIFSKIPQISMCIGGGENDFTWHHHSRNQESILSTMRLDRQLCRQIPPLRIFRSLSTPVRIDKMLSSTCCDQHACRFLPATRFAPPAHITESAANGDSWRAFSNYFRNYVAKYLFCKYPGP